MEFRENLLVYEDYYSLRQSVGWKNFSETQAKKALAASPYTITVVENGQTIAMGRLIGDGLYYIIADVVVHPIYQRRGIGSRIIDMLTQYVQRQLPAGGRASIQLIAEKGKEAFYEKKGFRIIPHEFCGSAMRKIIMSGPLPH